ncbi:MAG: RNA polymerase sigma factor [Candidatus Magasanikbacteria bacterium]|nr:RNA polymerase sigma factor [Candidatus Magasanikbacteria bacterium]
MKELIEEKLLLYKVQTEKDAEAFALLYDRYVDQVYRFVFFKLSHKQEAEDVTGDVFLKCWQFLTGEKGKTARNFRSLLYTIARNCVIDVYRSRSKQKEQSLADIDLDDGGVQKYILESKGDNEKIFVAMKKMKQEYQEVVLFKYIEDFSIGEIAAMTGKSIVSVRVTLHRALKKLRELLDE